MSTMIISKPPFASGETGRYVRVVGEEIEPDAPASGTCPCESKNCWRRHQKDNHENEAIPNKFRRLSIIIILLLFFYLYVADSKDMHGQGSSLFHKPRSIRRPSYESSPVSSKRERRSIGSVENARLTVLSNLQEHHYNAEEENCTLFMDETSVEFFNQLREKPANMIYFRLNFSAYINITADQYSYLPHRWVWTTFGRDHSSDMMLEYPFDFGLLSFGLLTRYAYKKQFDSKDEFIVNLYTKNSCNMALKLGTSEAAMTIRDTLLKIFTSDYKRQNNSQFCFESVVHPTSHSQVWWYATHMFTIAKDYTYFNCCEANTGLPCDKQYHQTYYMWLVLAWSLAIACFSPLFLHLLPDHKRKRTTDNRWALFESFSCEGSSSLIDVGYEPPDVRQEKWIFLGQDPTSVKPLLRKIMCLHKRSGLIRRIWRVVIVFLSLSVLIIKVIVYYFKEHDDVQESLRLNIPVGELCIPYGYNYCLQNSEYFLGGSLVYIPLFVILGSVLLCIPESIPDMFLDTKELQDDPNAPMVTFLFITDGVLETRGITRRQLMRSGYGCLAAKIKERFFMLFCVGFWKSFFAMCCGRLKRVNLIKVAYFLSGPSRLVRALAGGVAFIPAVLAWTLLIGICAVEFFLVILYYGVPLIFFVKLAISGLMSVVLNRLSLSPEHGTRLSYLRIVLGCIVSVVVLVATLFVTSVAIQNFVHSFLFLVNLLTFTFAGLVVYPEFSATYCIAAIAVLYYLTRSMSGFTEGYISLLQQAVHVSDCLQKSGWRPYGYRVEDDDYRPCFVKKHLDTLTLGIPRAAFDFVARMMQPIRVQVAIVFLKLLVTANVIYSTDMLTQAFRHGYNINLATRTMAVIFVGFVPEVFGVFSSRVRRIVDEEIFEKKVENCVKAYWQEHLKLSSYEAVP